MTKFRIALITIALSLTTNVFAMHMDMSDNKDCGAIADSCKAAGYTDDSSSKHFWQDCMEPVLMGKAVDGVTIDKKAAKSCRMNKIKELKQEAQKLQKVKG